ncbi:hypothetical protein [Methanococcoides alaskense]|uniref:Uncharacterized protein n=1 Tax=Methanococcoides alaskense TaxID=325778 RepID=A0AA90U0V9_9EURY|nr:hypothetical protein [Methanococcoides alaskense]MDA0524397.1 hypothetical protein [Methanococcoides alaskense]MDR6223214.1 hypothetical protein [Methanococcoides alaskense]
MIETILMKKFSSWKLSLFFSFIAYSAVLFFIIVVDVFGRRDFDPLEVGLITVGYMGAVMTMLAIGFIVFKKRMNSRI